MIAGFGREPLRPPVPFDPQGYAARDQSVTALDPALSVTACVIKGQRITAVILSADVLGHTGDFPDRVRNRVAAVVGCSPTTVLLAATHTHSSLWPGATHKISGGSLGAWLPGEQEYVESLPDIYARAAQRAAESARTARVSWGVGRAPGLSVNRRERTAHDGVILGWNPLGESDDSVTAVRFDEPAGTAIGLIVGFACHPVVVGAGVARATSDYVGPLRKTVESIRGGLCLFLQGASGDLQPLDALNDRPGKEVAFGRRVGLEALHAVADADPWSRDYRRTLLGRWTPTAVYRPSLPSDTDEQVVDVRAKTVDLPLESLPELGDLREEFAKRSIERAAAAAEGAPGSVTNGIDNQLRWLQRWIALGESGQVPRSVTAEVWAARIGSGALVGLSAEAFAVIGTSIRAASPAESTFVAGCCGSIAGYLPVPAEYGAGGFEVTMSHRIYDLPAAIGREAAGRIQEVSTDLLDELFPGGSGGAGVGRDCRDS